MADEDSQKESTKSVLAPSRLEYVQYGQDKEIQYLAGIRKLISKDLSEPYSIYVYRYFLYEWGHLCFLVRCSCHL